MKNKMFVAIGGAVAALCPWMTHAETFPSDGTMLENKTYESAATYDNLGTYEGTVSATAEYADILYQVGAGQYLPAGSEGVGAACTAGNYCPGLTGLIYSATSNQGLNACPNGYPNSEPGASVDKQCYTTCTDASVIPHATAVAGIDYYGNGVDTCYATACDNGYHIYNGIEMIERDPLISGAGLGAYAFNVGYISADDIIKDGEREFGLTEKGTWAAEFQYGTVYGQASCQSVASDGFEAMQSYSGMLMGVNVYTADEVRAELLEKLDAANANDIADVFVDLFVEYKAGTKTEEDAYKAVYALLLSEYDANFSKTDSGTYCYCQMTDFAPTGGVKGTVTTAPWVYEVAGGGGTAAACARNCALTCARSLQNDGVATRNFRAAVLGALGRRTVDICAANEISITWADADPADVAANNAGVCTYDGDIRTPAKAITKPGKTFKGWRFSKKN